MGKACRVLALVFIFLIIGVTLITAQVHIADTTSAVHSKKYIDSVRYRQKDAADFLTKTFKIKVKPDTAKLKPDKIYPSVFPALGYGLSNGVTFILASNMSFYTGNPNTHNLSVITLNPLYSLKQQVIVPIIGSIWLDNNKINVLGDYRFYQYPSLTYGLGGRRLLSQSDSVDYSYIKISQEALYSIDKDLYAGVGYNLDYHYNIKEFGDDPQYERYNEGATKTISSGWVVRLKFDNRTNSNNPQQAFYANFFFRNNTTQLGSTGNWQELGIEMRKYIRLSSHPRNVLAFWSWNEFTIGKVPYFDLPSTGWDDYSNTGRGFIQGRFRSTGIMYMEGEWRFDILRNGLLGGVLFTNAESVPNFPSGYFRYIHVGKGLGIRIKMNKYSDTNLCIDYGWGDGGSQGFFFNVGEVF